jgi:hypothetical protein
MATSVFAVTMVRDEADIVEATVRQMAGQVDRVIVADNLSVDGTREILERLAGELPIEVVEDGEPGYLQSEKMTNLANRAAAAGADWVVPFDADEVHRPRTGRRLADTLAGLPNEVLISEAQLFDHVATAQDSAEGSPLERMGWRRAECVPLRKVAVRAREGLTIHQGNHSATFDGVPHPPTVTTAVEIRHFPYRSAEQMIRKARNGAAAYAATDLPEEIGAHWRQYGRLTEEQIGEVFRRYFWSADPQADGLLHDPLR